MGKRDDLKTQIEKLQAEYEAEPDDDDADLEIVVEKDGQKTTVRGRHARKVMRRLGLDEEDQAPKDDDEDQDEDAGKKGAKKDAEPATGHRYFK